MSYWITLASIGPLDESLVHWLSVRLEQITLRSVEIHSSLPVPEHAFNARRGQYRGEGVLEVLHRTPSDSPKMLGLLDADCFAPGMTFIFGQAASDGRREAFVALARLHESFYGLPENEDLFRRRVLKESLHELGHAWGLGRCDNRQCVMHFSNTLTDTDVKLAQYCSLCHTTLENHWKEMEEKTPVHHH